MAVARTGQRRGRMVVQCMLIAKVMLVYDRNMLILRDEGGVWRVRVGFSQVLVGRILLWEWADK